MSTATLKFHNRPLRAGKRVGHDEAIPRLAKDADAIGMSEAGHMSDEELGRWLPKHRLERIPEHSPLPVLVAPGVDVIGRRHEMFYPETKVGKWGAGFNSMSPAWDQVVLLDKPEMEPFGFGIFHAVPSVSQDEEAVRSSARKQKIPEAEALESWRLRRKMHEIEMRGLVRLTRGIKRVVLMGDANCSPSYPDMEVFRENGFKIIAPGGDGIDLVIARGVEVIGTRDLPNDGSDHPAIEALIR